MNQFMPIDPTLLPSGALATLQPFFGDAGATPIPQPTSGATNLKVISFSGSLALAANVGISDIFNISGNYNDRALIQDTTVGQPAFGQNLPATAQILGTLWGCSLRVSVRVSGMDVNANTSLYMVAAAVQLKRAQAQYEIRGVGIGLSVLADALSGLPAVGTLDFTAFAQIDRFRSLLADALNNNPAQLGSLPIAVLLQSGLPPSDAITEAESIRQAMIGLANGMPLAICLARLRSNLLPSVVTDTYASQGLKTPTAPVSDAIRNAATLWVQGV